MDEKTGMSHFPKNAVFHRFCLRPDNRKRDGKWARHLNDVNAISFTKAKTKQGLEESGEV
jgi:hypothetical protein